MTKRNSLNKFGLIFWLATMIFTLISYLFIIFIPSLSSVTNGIVFISYGTAIVLISISVIMLSLLLVAIVKNNSKLEVVTNNEY